MIFLSTSTYANKDFETKQKFCKVMEAVAGTAQHSRQIGKKPSEVLDNLVESININHLNDTISIVVETAYLVDIKPTKELKDKAISDFEKNTYLNPDQPFKGTFNVRISPEMHRKAVLASSNSLNSFVSDAIQEKLIRLGV